MMSSKVFFFLLTSFWTHPDFNPLCNDKLLDINKLKASTDDKLNFAKMMISLFDKVENSVGKRENAV